MTRHQAGHLYESHGAFHVRYYMDGKQKSKKLCDKDRSTGCGAVTAKKVVMACEDFMRTVNDGSLQNVNTSLSVQTFWDTIYQPFIESTLKHSTVMGYKQIWNQHLKTHFSNILLVDYKTSAFSLFLTQLAKTYRPRTLAHLKFLASAVFAHSLAMGLCETNPIRDAKVLSKTLSNGQTEAYTLEEIEDTISALKDHVECQLIVALAFFLGLRKGEIAGLQWGDIDDNAVHIRRAIGRGMVGTPKTAKSTRSVPLIAPVRLFLGLWRQKCKCAGWVFPSQDGLTPISFDRKTELMRDVLKKEGLPWKGLHACRRGLGTALRSLTGNSNAGRDMLGHSNAQVTEQHYEAAMPEEVLRGMKLLEEKVTLTKR